MSIASPRQRVLLGISLVLSVLLYAVDSTIVNVALPHIQGSLQATQDQVAWVATAYLIASVVLTPMSGWLATRVGMKRILLLSVVGFTIASLLCGVASSLAEMVFYRAVQGACGSSLVLLSQIALLRDFPRESHTRVMSAWASAALIGPVVGPALGGYLTESLSWRWAFFINLPIGILAWIGVSASMPRDRDFDRKPFDVTGFVFLSLALGLFQLMLDRGQSRDWFNSQEIIAEAFFAATFLWMYIWHWRYHQHAFVDLGVFRDRNFVTCLLIQIMSGALILAPGVLLPAFLQQIQGYPADAAGNIVASRGMGSMVAMLIAGQIASRMDARFCMIAGALIAAAALQLSAFFSVDTPATTVFLAGILLGLAMPLMFIPSQVLAYATLRESQRTAAGVLLRVALSLGGGVGISLCVSKLTRDAQVNQAYLSEFFTPYSQERWSALGSVAGPNAATGQLLAEMHRQALSISYDNIYFVLSIAALFCIPAILAMKVSRVPGVRSADSSTEPLH